MQETLLLIRLYVWYTVSFSLSVVNCSPFGSPNRSVRIEKKPPDQPSTIQATQPSNADNIREEGYPDTYKCTTVQRAIASVQCN